MGIGLAISCSALIQVIILFSIWNRKSDNRGSRSVYGFYLKCFIISLPVAGCLMLTQGLLSQWIEISSKFGSIGMIVIQGLFFLLLMVAATWAFKLDEARVVWDKIIARFSKSAR